MQFPLFPEESGSGDSAGRLRGGGNGDVDDRPIRQLRGLPRVVFVIEFAEGKAAVKDNISLGVQRVGINQHWHMRAGGIGLVADVHRLRVPMDRQLVRDFREQRVAGGIAEEDQVARCDVGFRDGRVVFETRFAAELFSPGVDGVSLLACGPGANLLVDRFSRWFDDDE